MNTGSRVTYQGDRIESTCPENHEHSGCFELIKTAIHEVSENFRHEIDKLRHEVSGHRVLNPPLTETAEVTSL